MKVSAWTNGRGNPATGSGYGIRIRKSDRDKYFDKNKPRIIIHLSNGKTISAYLSKSFWTTCPEVRHRRIGKWILKNITESECKPEKHKPPLFKRIVRWIFADYQRGVRKWEKGKPPQYNLIPISKEEFELTL